MPRSQGFQRFTTIGANAPPDVRFVNNGRVSSALISLSSARGRKRLGEWSAGGSGSFGRIRVREEHRWSASDHLRVARGCRWTYGLDEISRSKPSAESRRGLREINGADGGRGHRDAVRGVRVRSHWRGDACTQLIAPTSAMIDARWPSCSANVRAAGLRSGEDRSDSDNTGDSPAHNRPPVPGDRSCGQSPASRP